MDNNVRNEEKIHGRFITSRKNIVMEHVKIMTKYFSLNFKNLRSN